jgi:hypothetical protein
MPSLNQDPLVCTLIRQMTILVGCFASGRGCRAGEQAPARKTSQLRQVRAAAAHAALGCFAGGEGTHRTTHRTKLWADLRGDRCTVAARLEQ